MLSSLEKKMFFLPNRLFVQGYRLFVSFNIAVIPVDMNVLFIAFHALLPKISRSAVMYVKEITADWNEKSIKNGIFPPCTNTRYLPCYPGQDELIIDITAFNLKWRFKNKENYGIYLKLKTGEAVHFPEDNPPYLIVDTI